MYHLSINKLSNRPLNFAIANTIWDKMPEKNFDDYWWNDDIFIRHNIEKYPKPVDFEFDPQGQWIYGGYYFENYVHSYHKNKSSFSNKKKPFYVENDKTWAIGETCLIATCRLILKTHHGNDAKIHIPECFFIKTFEHNIIANNLNQKIKTHPS